MTKCLRGLSNALIFPLTSLETLPEISMEKFGCQIHMHLDVISNRKIIYMKKKIFTFAAHFCPGKSTLPIGIRSKVIKRASSAVLSTVPEISKFASTIPSFTVILANEKWIFSICHYIYPKSRLKITSHKNMYSINASTFPTL